MTNCPSLFCCIWNERNKKEYYYYYGWSICVGIRRCPSQISVCLVAGFHRSCQFFLLIAYLGIKALLVSVMIIFLCLWLLVILIYFLCPFFLGTYNSYISNWPGRKNRIIGGGLICLGSTLSFDNLFASLSFSFNVYFFFYMLSMFMAFYVLFTIIFLIIHNLAENEKYEKQIEPWGSLYWLNTYLYRFDEFGVDGGPAAKELIPKFTVIKQHISSKLGLGVPNIDVRHWLFKFCLYIPLIKWIFICCCMGSSYFLFWRYFYSGS